MACAERSLHDYQQAEPLKPAEYLRCHDLSYRGCFLVLTI
jgi:hypothetical protein